MGSNEGGIQTSPYSFVSHISKSGRRLPSCSLQRTMGCIVPDTPLKETEALSSRFAALVFAVKVGVSIGWDAHEKKKDKGLTGWISKPNLYPRDHAQEMWNSAGQSLHRMTAP